MASDAPAEVELGGLAAALDAGDGREERFLVDLLVGLAHHFAGEPVAAAEPLTRALAVSGELTRPTLLLAAGRAAMYLGDDAVAICTSAAVVQRARRFGEVGAVPIPRTGSPCPSCSRAVDGGAARRPSQLRLSLATGQEELVPLAHCWLALHAALRGRADECTTTSRRPGKCRATPHGATRTPRSGRWECSTSVSATRPPPSPTCARSPTRWWSGSRRWTGWRRRTRQATARPRRPG